MSKPKTQAQLDRATDQRLRKTYGITLSEYKKLCAVHKGCCWICHKPPGTKRLAVEHDHSWKKVKIESRKCRDGWELTAQYNGNSYVTEAKKRSDALRLLREDLKRASVRGVCCPWCNRGLRYYHDSMDLLINAARYLDNFRLGCVIEILDKETT
jgi:hypothetical protein